MSNTIKAVNVIKLQSPFERLKSYTSSPDVNLRRAIITQAIIDATNVSDCRRAKKIEQEAKTWIFGGEECFKTICMESGIEPSFVTRITTDLIKLHRHKSNLRKSAKNNSLGKSKEETLRKAA